MWKWTAHRNPKKATQKTGGKPSCCSAVRPTKETYQEEENTHRCWMLQRGQLRSEAESD